MRCGASDEKRDAATGQRNLAFGHGHTGLTAAPMTARIVAGMVAGAPLNLDVRPYRATRF